MRDPQSSIDLSAPQSSFDLVEQARPNVAPFDELVDENPGARRAFADMILANDARPSFLIVNNKAEGCSPRSILALAETLAGAEISV